MKRIISVFVSLSLIFSLCTLTALAETGDGLNMDSQVSDEPVRVEITDPETSTNTEPVNNTHEPTNEGNEISNTAGDSGNTSDEGATPGSTEGIESGSITSDTGNLSAYDFIGDSGVGASNAGITEIPSSATLEINQLDTKQNSPDIKRTWVVFGEGTSLSNLHYSGFLMPYAQYLPIKGAKPVINVYSSGEPWSLRVSYDVFTVGDEPDTSMLFALRDDNNDYTLIDPGIVYTAYTVIDTSGEESGTQIPWGEDNDDLLKLYLPANRDDLLEKTISTTVYWSLELIP